jgi:excisionase family DNA binding protein
MTGEVPALKQLVSAKRDTTEAEADPTLLALTVEEAARRLCIGRTTMYALIREGAIQTVSIGHLRRVPVQALRDYVTARMSSPSRSQAA